MKEIFSVSRKKFYKKFFGDEKILQSNDVNLKKLMSEIKNGLIQLPSIQREWIWYDEQIRDIIASVISDYPIGAVLFLQCKSKPDFEYSPIKGVVIEKETDIENLILDGQQRLTAIFGAMYNVGNPVEVRKSKNSDKYEERFYYLDIEKAVNDSSDIDAIISVPKDKKIKKSKKIIELDLSDEKKEFDKKMFPLNIILCDDKNLMTKSKWVNTCKKYYRDEKNSDEKILDDLDDLFEKFDKLQAYTIPVISLGKDTPMEAVCKIFEKVNSGNSPLSGFDLSAAIYAKHKFNLKDNWEVLKKSKFSQGILDKFEPKDFLRACKFFVNHKKNISNFKKNIVTDLKCEDYQNCFEIVSEGFSDAKTLLEEEGITIKKNLPYEPQLISLAVICALLKDNNNSVFDSKSTRQKVMQWYWCCVFSEHYGNGANDSKLFSDITNFMKWINEGEVPEIIKNFEFDLAKFKEITSNTSALFSGIVALLVKNNCKDFANGRKIKDLYTDKNVSVEIHHIFPKKSYNVSNGTLNESILNKTPLSKSTNDILGDIAPSKYLKNIITGLISEIKPKKKSKKNSQKPSTELVSEEDLKEHLKSHLIDMEDLENDNFENFICHRVRKIFREICNATGKNFLEPSDEDIKKIFFG